jgi:hypothetical protein
MARILSELERGFPRFIGDAKTRKMKAALQSVVEHWSRHEGIAEDWLTISKLIQDEELLDSHL